MNNDFSVTRTKLGNFFLAALLHFCGFWRLHGDLEQRQPDTVLSSLAALLTRLTHSGAP